jgi:hypothetical protein
MDRKLRRKHRVKEVLMGQLQAHKVSWRAGIAFPDGGSV